MEEKFDYENEIHIDETALDVEWLEQPKLMIKYAKYASLMRKKLELAKEELELVKSELDRDIRNNPESYGLSKATDASVASTMPRVESYKEASKAVIEAKFEADLSMYIVKAFEQRKDALENLVKLHGQQYFAGPKVPRDLSKEREQKNSNQIVKKSIVRRG